MESTGRSSESTSSFSPSAANRKSALRGLVSRPSSFFRKWKQQAQLPQTKEPAPMDSTFAGTFVTNDPEENHEPEKVETHREEVPTQSSQEPEHRESKEEEAPTTTNPIPSLQIQLRTRFSFHGTPGSDELDVTAGETLIGLSRNEDWWIALGEGDKVGLIPVSYCTIVS